MTDYKNTQKYELPGIESPSKISGEDIQPQRHYQKESAQDIVRRCEEHVKCLKEMNAEEAERRWRVRRFTV